MTPADVARFKKLVGMLGSDQAGERAAAALLATNWLTERGLGWQDVSVPGGAAVPSGEVLKPMGSSVAADLMKAAKEAREAMEAMEAHLRAARRARWEQNADQPDADGFHARSQREK